MSAPAFSAGMFDALREVLNIGIGRAARSLAELTAREVSLQVIEIELLDLDRPRGLADLYGPGTLRISQAFGGILQGHAMVTFNHTAAARLAAILLGKTGGAEEAFDELEHSALLELGNIMIGAVTGELASALDAPVTYGLPQLRERHIESAGDLFSDLSGLQQVRVLLVRASLHLAEEDISGCVILLFPEPGYRALTLNLARITA